MKFLISRYFQGMGFAYNRSAKLKNAKRSVALKINFKSIVAKLYCVLLNSIFSQFLVRNQNISPEEIEGVILHIGTNDASTTRVNKTIQEIMKDYANLLWKLETIYQESHIARSLCIPRLDEFAERAQELNSVRSP